MFTSAFKNIGFGQVEFEQFILNACFSWQLNAIS